MSAAQMLIEDGLLKGDLDAGGFKILNLDTSNLGEFTNQVPFADSQAIIKGSVDPTKLARFEVDGFTTATTRVFTLPNYNGQLATLAGAEALTGKTYNGLTLSGSGGGIELNNGIISISEGQLVLDGDVTIGGSGANLTLLFGIDTTLTLPSSGTVAVTSQIPVISDTAYNEATWNGNTDGATKNAIRDKFESLTTATSQPFSDATALVKGSANSLKQFRIEVDQLSTGIRVMTPPDYDFIPASIAGEEALIKKVINGLTFAVGDASSAGGAVTYDETPAAPFLLNLVAISQVGTTCVLRTTAPTDIVLPTTGTVATVAGTIPFAYLSVNKDLGGSLASDVKVPTQLAIKTYFDSHSGAGIEPVSGATLASDTSVDLSGTAVRQIDITGTTNIESFVLDEGDEKVLVFQDDLELIQGEFLSLKGGRNMPVKAGTYVIVRGQADGVVQLVFGETSEGYKQDTFDNIYLNFGGNIGFGDNIGPYFDIGRSTDSGSLGSFMKIIEGDHVTLMKHDASAGVRLNISEVTTDTRELMFPDSAGTLGLLVAAPVTVNDAGKDGLWAKDASFVYVYHAGNSKWGRAALSYVW